MKKYIVTTTYDEIVYGSHGVSSKKEAIRIAKEMVDSDYENIQICEVVPVCKVKKSKPKLVFK
jgi:hypothetical protein